MDQPRFGLGFIPDEPIKIRTRKDGKYATVQYISADNGKSDENQKPNDNRVSVFKRLGAPTARASVFERLGEASEDSSNNTRRSQRGSVFDCLGDGGPINVKQHVAGKPHDSSETLNEEEIEIIIGSNHVSIDEGSDSDISEDEIQNAPPQLEDGVQATVDELKELNLVERVLCSDLIPRIEIEVNKLIDAGFIREVKYPTWISSIMPVKKKNGQIRICVDFRELNKACPKDDFSLPIIELMVDATTGHEVLFFMDGSSGYNQIRMSPKDEECTTFRTPKGIYCYKVECYMDDLVIKTKKREEHLADLQIVFDRLRKYNLKMNPLKCAFGVTSGKFLGFIVRHHGIEVDPAKVDAIQKIPPPRNLKELRSLQGNLAFIRRFISNLTGRCQPFNHLMKKDTHFQWDEGCQNAFESIKRYLLNPPVLGAPVPGKPLILYIAAQERSIGSLMAQENE
ncbi:UNVERIFIED_CONTAM: Transposon Tf2-12 polyprotein [Sesamum latifolium]|uniref:Transposon Tf2-12 polyprotein n=1 Tax=Sesamum latifolium TaxID=2727402 RepID=A0AAW2TMK2_9LAMI